MPRQKKSRGAMAVRSEEDKPMYLQQRAQAEAEMAQKKEEILTHFLRDKLQDDERNTALNLLKLNDGWRAILRQSKSTELKKDIEVLHQTFERQLNGLDSKMKNLEVNIAEAGSQEAQLHQPHHSKIEKLLELQKKRMDFLEERWESTVENIKRDYSCQREQISAEIQQQYRDIEDNSLLMQHKNDEMMSGVAEVYRQDMDFDDTLFFDNKSNLEKNPEEVHKKHQQPMEQPRVEHQKYIETIQKDQAELKDLQTKCHYMELSLTRSDNAPLKLEGQLSATSDDLKTLWTNFEFIQNQERKLITSLTVNSDKATKKLLTVVRMGEKILRLAKLSKKLEDELLICDDLQTPSENKLAELHEKPKALTFMELNHQNSALLKCEALRTQRDAVQQENSLLQLKIKLLLQHQETMAVSGHSLPSPLQFLPSLSGTGVHVAAGQKKSTMETS